MRDSPYEIGERVINPVGRKAIIDDWFYDEQIDKWNYLLDNWLGWISEKRLQKISSFAKHKAKLNI